MDAVVQDDLMETQDGARESPKELKRGTGAFRCGASLSFMLFHRDIRHQHARKPEMIVSRV